MDNIRSFLNRKTINWKNAISLGILLFITYLFSYKYIARYSNNALLFSITIIFITLCLWFISKRIIISNRIFNLVSFTILILYIVGMIYLFRIIPAQSLNVDRWSIITSFWDAVFNGKYPYLARSNSGNHPGPMPIYFVLALPFYLLNEIGYFSLFGVVLFIVYLMFKRKQNQEIFFILLFLISTPFMLWEVTVRSTIFTNSVIILIYIIWMQKTDLSNKKKLIISGLIGGLLLSTRNVFAPVFLLFLLNNLFRKRIHLKMALLWGISVLFSFLLSFSPFLILYFNDFLKMNPFIIQSTYLIPPGYIAIFIIIAIYLSYISKDNRSVIFFSGVLLFSISLIYFIFHISQIGFKKAYFDSVVDISYFIFSVPFFLYSLQINKGQWKEMGQFKKLED